MVLIRSFENIKDEFCIQDPSAVVKSDNLDEVKMYFFSIHVNLLKRNVRDYIEHEVFV